MLCETLIHSQLGMQCEELLIKVENHDVNGMYHLQMLQIQYQLGPPAFFDNYRYEKENETFLNWLKYQLPLTCIIVSEDSNSLFSGFSKIWFQSSFLT